MSHKELRELSLRRNSNIGVHDPFVAPNHDLVVIALERQKRSGSKAGQHRGGIGIRFKLCEDGTFLICHVAKGGAASKSGQVHVGDVIHDVNGVDVRGLTLEDVGRLTKGPPGTTVIIALERVMSSKSTAAARNIFPTSSQSNEYQESGESNAVFATRSNTTPPDSSNKRNVIITERALPSPHGMLLDEEEETGTSSSDADSVEFDASSPELRRNENLPSSSEASPAKAASTRSSNPENKLSVWNVTLRRNPDARERCGVGLVLGKADDDCFIVTRTLPGSAAAQLVLDGIIAAGDRIVAVDGSAVKGKSLDEAVDMLRGRPETTVQITIHRRGNVHYNAGMMQQWPARRPQQRAADRNGHVTFSSKPSAVWVDPDEEHRKSKRGCPTPILEKHEASQSKSGRSAPTDGLAKHQGALSDHAPENSDPPPKKSGSALKTSARNAKQAVLVEPVHGLALQKWGGGPESLGGGSETTEISAEEEDGGESLEEMRRQLLVLTNSLGAAVKEVRDVKAGKARAVQEGRERVSELQDLVDDLKLQTEDLRRELSGKWRIQMAAERTEGTSERERKREKEREDAAGQARSLLSQVRQLLRENQDLREARDAAYDVIKVQEKQILSLKEEEEGGSSEDEREERERGRGWEEREREEREQREERMQREQEEREAEWESERERGRERGRERAGELGRVREDLALGLAKQQDLGDQVKRLTFDLQRAREDKANATAQLRAAQDEASALHSAQTRAPQRQNNSAEPAGARSSSSSHSHSHSAEVGFFLAGAEARQSSAEDFLRESLAELSQQHCGQLSALRAALTLANQKLAVAEANGFLLDAPPPPPRPAPSPHRPSPSASSSSHRPPPPSSSSSSSAQSPYKSRSVPSRPFAPPPPHPQQSQHPSPYPPPPSPSLDVTSYPPLDVTARSEDKSGAGHNSVHQVHERVGPLSLSYSSIPESEERDSEREESEERGKGGREEGREGGRAASPRLQSLPPSSPPWSYGKPPLSPPRGARRQSLEASSDDAARVEWETRKRVEEAQRTEIERAERESASAKRELLRAIQSAETAVKNSQRSLVSQGRC